MIVVLTIGFIAIICALLDSLGIWKHGLAFGFILTTILLAIHSDYGNDFPAYQEWFRESYEKTLPMILFGKSTRAPGWDIINMVFARLFGNEGLAVLVFVISIIQSYLYYWFIKKYVDVKWFWFAMSVYILNNHFYLLSFSMLRQSLAMAICLVVLSDIYEKRFWRPLILIVISIVVHSSIIVMLPFLLFSFFEPKHNKILALLSFTFLIVFLASTTILYSIINKFTAIPIIQQYVQTYTGFGEAMTFGLGFVIKLIPFGIALWALWNNRIEQKENFFYIVWLLSLIMLPFGGIFPIFNRILFYFELASFVVLPKIYQFVSNKFLRIGFIALSYMMYAIAVYSGYIAKDGIYYEAFRDFTTIF